MSRKKPQRRPRKTTGATPEGDKPAIWNYFVQVNSTRCKLKEEPARLLYALAHLIADEHQMRCNTLRSMAAGAPVPEWGKSLFHHHASAALRMLADRLIKSFPITDLIRSEQYSGEMYVAALAAFTKSEKSRPSLS